MTKGERRWLLKLRDEGPQKRPRYGSQPCVACISKGWSRWVDMRASDLEEITDAGLDALHDEP